jgi:hypothetical protein
MTMAAAIAGLARRPPDNSFMIAPCRPTLT